MSKFAQRKGEDGKGLEGQAKDWPGAAWVSSKRDKLVIIALVAQ